MEEKQKRKNESEREREPRETWPGSSAVERVAR
jgi:hypothetical protein